MTRVSLKEFARVFRHNLHERSRTAKGVSDVSSSKSKKPLLKSGAELAEQVESNTSRLINLVWLAGSVKVFRALTLRKMMENWYDVVNYKLQDEDAYRDDYVKLVLQAGGLRLTDGRDWRVNRRYRTWNVGYTTRNIPPLELEFAMDKFYEDLVSIVFDSNFADFSQARLLAFADLEIDGEIHPWADDCGRMSTAAVMWLSLLRPDFRLPVFGSRDEHYAHIRDLELQTDYYRKCLSR